MEPILANQIRYSSSKIGQLCSNAAVAYQPTEAELKERAEYEVKQARKDDACVVLALAERFLTYQNISVEEAFKKAEEFNETGRKFFESKL